MDTQNCILYIFFILNEILCYFTCDRYSDNTCYSLIGNLTVIKAKNVILSGDNSVNTINTTPARNETDMEKTGRLRRKLEI